MISPVKLELDPHRARIDAHKWYRRLYAFAALAAVVGSFTTLVGYDVLIPFDEAEAVIPDETVKLVASVTAWAAAGSAILGLLAQILQISAEDEVLKRIDRASADH